MRLKWLPVRLRRRRRVSRVAVDSAPGRRPATSLHFCGGPANVSFSRPRRAPREGGSAPRRGELIARRRSRRSGEGLRRVLRVLSHVAAQASRGRAPPRRRESEASTACSGRLRRCLRRGGRSHLAPQSLVPGWPHPTRLETRTKECNMRASPRVANPSAQ